MHMKTLLLSPFTGQDQTLLGTQVRTTALRNEVDERTKWPECYSKLNGRSRTHKGVRLITCEFVGFGVYFNLHNKQVFTLCLFVA